MMLDYVRHLELPDDVCKRRLNQFNSLRYLHEGMTFLYRQVKQSEAVVYQRLDSRRARTIYGNDPALAGMPMGLLSCSFHWYAVSACNYVRLVGWLLKDARCSDQDPLKYVEDVLPDVKPFRDKVAAHFAQAAGSRRDNQAEREMSVMPPIGFVDDAFCANPVLLLIGAQHGNSNSEALAKWSLTKVHESLMQRYGWPADRSPLSEDS